MARRIIGRTQKNSVEEPVINLTPLIDVVFVILIMFIILAPLLEMENIRLADASAVGKNMKEISKETGPISVQVFSDETIKFNGNPVSLERLKDVLIEAKKIYPNASPQLFQDSRAPFGTYQSVKNAFELAGFDEIDLVLKPSS